MGRRRKSAAAAKRREAAKRVKEALRSLCPADAGELSGLSSVCTIKEVYINLALFLSGPEALSVFLTSKVSSEYFARLTGARL